MEQHDIEKDEFEFSKNNEALIFGPASQISRELFIITYYTTPSKRRRQVETSGFAMSSTSAATVSSSSSTASSQFTYTTGTYFPTPFHLQQLQTYVAAAAAASILQFPAPPPAVSHVYPAPATVPTAYSLPQYQQAQQLFQRDAQTITPEALESVKAALASSEIEHKADTKKKAVPRKAAGQAWEDPTLADWPENDSRLFCGDLGNELNDDVLSKAFSRFPSFNMARDWHEPLLKHSRTAPPRDG